MKERYDVAILGAGFSGSILARILAKQGRSVALIDAATHPRFAIGESSTPIADRLLQRLGEQYGLSDLVSLSTHGEWKHRYPDLACGRKRGFSYFVHHRDQSFADSDDHHRSLMVAASASDAGADTHWYRSQVDQHLFQQAIAAGVKNLTGYRVQMHQPRPDVQLCLQACVRETQSGPESMTVHSDWIVDASGQAAVLAQLAGVPNRTEQLRTNTRSTFAHFENVRPWTEHLRQLGIHTENDPFDADDSAQHHLLRAGWLWMLRFDNGITSVGRTSRVGKETNSSGTSTLGHATSLHPSLDLSRYPSVAAMLEQATLVAPLGGPRITNRLQRLYDPVIDDRKLMIPTAAVTIDPLHSTGIAHGLVGVDRIASIILAADGDTRRAQTERYRQAVLSEAEFLDGLVATAYETMSDFPRFVAACTLYFAGAIRCEERYQCGETPSQLWNSDDLDFLRFARESCELLCSDETTEKVVSSIRQAIQPWNSVGLLNPEMHNRYAYTATKQ